MRSFCASALANRILRGGALCVLFAHLLVSWDFDGWRFMRSFCAFGLTP